MNNYEYIIASLPVLGKDAVGLDADALISGIRSRCTDADNALIDKLLDGFNPDKLDAAFYDEALKSSNHFLREFLRFDLQVRNTKVEYLNTVLERLDGLDIIPYEQEFTEKSRVMEILSGTDILKREKALDDLMWEKADSLILMDLFDIDVILAFIAKLKIADRWHKLDEGTGREMFRHLVNEIRNTR
ncbi:MAG: DUF2764 family protein [Bacteroidales bacterium]|nr:DUF2764 family protein [Bacteroidales bacterium]